MKNILISIIFILSLTTDQTFAAILSPPTPVSPGDASSPGSLITTSIFIWSPVSGATGYGLYLRDLTTGTAVFSSNGAVTNVNGYNLPAGYLAAGHSFRWAVTTVNADGESAQSTYRYFQTGLPNLVPWQPANWSDKIVVNNVNSSVSGPQTDAASLTTLDPIYVYIAGANRGTADILTDNYADIYLDGVFTQVRMTLPPANLSNYWAVQFAPGHLGAGTHSVRIVNDPTGSVTESNETDNEYTKTFTVAATGSEPQISSVSPDPVPGSNSQQIITVNGSRFANKPTVTLSWTGQPNYTVPTGQITYVNDTQLLMAITTELTLDTWTVAVSNPDGQTSNRLPFQVVAAPDIVVQQPLNTTILDGGSKSFGTAVVGTNTSLTFTIKNTGTLDLTGLTMTKDGADAGMFSVTSFPTAPVSAPSGSTTFTVKFAPTSAGSKVAALHIATNIPGSKSLYDITLTGTGVNAPLPSYLTIQGPASVLANGTASYTCLATYADTSTTDVSDQVAWSVSGGSSGTYMNGSSLTAGTGASSTATITASIGSTSTGVRSKSVSVTIGGGLSVSIQTMKQPTYLSGSILFLNYRLEGTASVAGGTGNITAVWTMDGITTLQGSTPILDAVVPAIPGNHEITVTITDGTGAQKSAKISVLMPKAPQVDEKLSSVPVGPYLPNPGKLFETDAVSEYDANSAANVARRNNGLVIIIHGMDNQVTADSSNNWNWMQRMGEAIQGRLASNPPNIILYDWKADAAVTSVSTEKFEAIKDELGMFSATSLTIRSMLLKTAVVDLAALFGSGLEYAIRVSSLRPNGEAHGQALADYLAGEILEGRVDPTAPIHLIGHSAGGFVASNCGRLLMTSKHWDQPGNIKPKKFQVTTLDTPILQVEQIRAIRNNNGHFERNISSLIGNLQFQEIARYAYGVPVESLITGPVNAINQLSTTPTPEFAEADNYHQMNESESAKVAWLNPVNQHVNAHEWYIHTVPTPNDLEEGFYYAPLPWGHAFPGGAAMAPFNYASLSESAPPPTFALSGFSTFGNVNESGTGTYTLTEQGNAGIYQELTLPMNVSTVKFRIQFTQAGDGDFIEVSFGDHLSLAVVADGAILRAGLTEFEVPIVAFGGETGQFLIKLNGVGADNAIAVVDNISITTDDDADGDGLTFAQETALGTDPRYYDTDSDGIGDWEEMNTTLTNPLKADSDGDGLTDEQEIIAGTSGVDATSVFRTNGMTVAANGNVTITWAARTGKTYRVQRSDAPDFANYTVVGDGLTGVEPTTSFTDSSVPGGTPLMFYRVEVE